MHRTTAAGLLIGATLLIAACGGGTSPTQAPAAQTQGPGSATQAPAATEGPGAATQAPAATVSGGGGGGTASAACDLITPEEAAGILDSGALTTTGGEVAGQTYCDYRTADGQTVLTTYMQANAAQLWSVYESSLQTDPVSGIGDKAMFEASTKLLLVLKGSTFFNVFVSDIDLSPEQALEVEKELAQVMAGRA